MDWHTEIARIEQFIRDNAPNGVVIGISGGVDSAVVYELCVRALGGKRVHPFYLGYGGAIPSEITCSLCKKEDMPLSFVNINNTIETILSNILILNIDKKVRGNVISRVRMTYLYYIANLHNLRVVGTTNRSEWLCGYFTKFGDGACDFEPILHLYKTEVIELAKELGIPQEIIDKAPSADLWDGQTDEAELGLTYEEIDRILQGELTNSEDMVRVLRLQNGSEHKRQLPPSLLEVY